MDLGLVSLIYQYLTVKEMLNATLTCKLWRSSLKYVKRSFRPKSIYPFINYQWVNKVDLPSNFTFTALINFRHCEEVIFRFNSVYPVHLGNLLSTGTKVKTLKIYLADYIYYLDFLDFSYFKNIEHVYFYDTLISEKYESFENFRNLKSFHLINRPRLGLNERFELFSYLSNVETIEICWYSLNLSLLGLSNVKCKNLILKGKFIQEDVKYLRGINFKIITRCELPSLNGVYQDDGFIEYHS